MPIFDVLPQTPIVIDTDIFTHLRNNHEYVRREITKYFSTTKSFPAITSMTIFEANYGMNNQIAKKINTSESSILFLQSINNALGNISEILPFDKRASEIAAYIYPHLLVNESKWLQKRKAKKKKGNREQFIWQDVFIISTALAHNYGFVTQNTEDVEIIAKYLPVGLDLRLAIWKP